MARITRTDALDLLRTPILSLGRMADDARRKATDPAVVTYHIDRNINYTDVCECGCSFCYYYRERGGYFLTDDELAARTGEAREQNADQILLQGGMRTDIPFERYVAMIRTLAERFPDMQIHAFSPPEIIHFSRLSGKSVAEVLKVFIDAGLDSLPGGGAEILVDAVRARVSPKKCTADEWISVMRTAHTLGLKASATMMFGFGESEEDRITHMLRLRELQDETDGFVAFIPWTYQGGSRTLAPSAPYSGESYLRTLALSRLVLDNIPNVQASWLTQGLHLGQMALFFGANDMGSVMLEENVVRAAGTAHTTDERTLREVITAAGFTPRLRDFYYHYRDDVRGMNNGR
ncbi:MAG: CofH family radical SAM protein [Spirochaetota bacterium]